MTYRCDGLKAVGGSCGLVEPRTCMADLPQRLNILTIGWGLFRNRMPARRALSTFRGYRDHVCQTCDDSSCANGTSTHLDILQDGQHEQIKLRIAPSDNHAWRRRPRKVVWPEYPQQSIAHKHVVILQAQLEGASTAQLFPRRYAQIRVSRMLKTG